MSPSPMLRAPVGAAANNRLAFDLYARLADARPGGNLCFSPFSVSAALAMLHAGAGGQTAREIQAVLRGDPGAPIEPARLQDPYGKPFPADAQPFRMANALWADDAYPIRPDYADLLARRHGAEVRSVDFVEDREPTRRVINDWVARKTGGRIADLIARPLEPDTRLILTSAVHFLAKWRSPFDPSLTTRQAFRLEGGGTRDVQLMHKRYYARYVAGDGFRSAAVEYENGQRMWVILPDEGRPLAEVEAALSADVLTGAWSAAQYDQELFLWLPRFRVRARSDLTAALRALGMATAFTERADFSGMHDPHPRPLLLSGVIHEAFIDVNEERTEAAAATATVAAGGGAAALPRPVELRCDRPFLFAIRDGAPGSILFMGRVTDPGAD